MPNHDDMDVAELLEDSSIDDPTTPNDDTADDFADVYADPGDVWAGPEN